MTTTGAGGAPSPEDHRAEATRRLGFTLTEVRHKAVCAVLAGRDTVLVSPTGSGKSASLDVGEAAAVSSLHGARAREAALARLAAGELEFVLLGPEQLRRADVRTALRQRGLDRLVVDEAHCIDLWGADLRPDDAALGAIRADLGDPPVLATTATAPPTSARRSPQSST